MTFPTAPETHDRTGHPIGEEEPDGRVSRFGVDGTGVTTDEYNTALAFDEQANLVRTTRIVVGLDGSPSSLAALRKAVTLAAGSNSAVQGVVAWQIPNGYGGYNFTDWSPETDALQIMNKIVKDAFEGTAPEWFTPVVRQGNAAAVLVELSKGAEMLVVGSRGHGGFAGLLLGSVSTACAEHAHCPVLVMHDDDA
ncbi:MULTISPECIES: universal stress protein [Subtercola]|uniref:Universal stress protein n=1 Tax=Subtercola vilae TaxID=2056433 RepID=A0A4T2C884_9MICO|nr:MULTISPECIES: universal stress protein [Subtercola]MEA9984900.1 universal stress protein [Subtercola sp. RTI3]TIH40437.1 universal stress protein [Subtercola vilae]